MSETAKIGSAEWWTATADKVLDFGLDVLRYKTNVPSPAKTDSPTATVLDTGVGRNLPYILGAAAVVGIAVILIKR